MLLPKLPPPRISEPAAAETAAVFAEVKAAAAADEVTVAGAHVSHAVVVQQPGCAVVAAVASVIFSLAAAPASRLAIITAAVLAGTSQLSSATAAAALRPGVIVAIISVMLAGIAALVVDFRNADATAAKLPNAEVVLENDKKLLLLPMLAAQSLTLRLEKLLLLRSAAAQMLLRLTLMLTAVAVAVVAVAEMTVILQRLTAECC